MADLNALLSPSLHPLPPPSSDMEHLSGTVIDACDQDLSKQPQPSATCRHD